MERCGSVAYFEDIRKSMGIMDVQKSAAGGEGLTPDYLSFRNTYWGQMQPVNYEMLWRIYTESPEVFGCINALTDAVIGDGWELKPLKKKVAVFEDPDADKAVMEFQRILKENKFDSTIRDIVSSLMIFGDSFTELVRAGSSPKVLMDVSETTDSKNREKVKGAQLNGKALENFNVEDYEEQHYLTAQKRLRFIKAMKEVRQSAAGAGDSVRRLDAMTNGVGRVVEFYPRASETIRIDYNEHGEVIKYIQRVKHRRVDYYPDEMIHFRMNVIGNRAYGHSSLMSLVQTMQAKMSAEGYTTDFFKRGFMPRIIYVTKNLSEEQVKRMRTSLQNLKPQQDAILFGEVDPKIISPSNVDLQFTALLKYLREQIFIALQVPPTLMGITEGANRNTSQTQMEMFDRKKRTLQREIAAVINNELFTPENFGVDVQFSFKDDNTREELKKAQTFKLMESSSYVHPNEVREIYDLPPLTEEELTKLSDLKTKMTPIQQGAFGGGFKNNEPNAVTPDKSGDKMDRAEAQNTEQQKENKSFKKSDHIEAEIAESKGERRQVEQGSITRRDAVYALGREGERYPFGAQGVENEASRYNMTAYAIHRTREIYRAMLNAQNPGNAFDLNTDPAGFDKPEEIAPKEGVHPAESISSPSYQERNKDPERNELNDQGKVVWAAPDAQKGVVKAVFYKDMTQLDETESDAKP
jgi:HK97 family phage portal protein